MAISAGHAVAYTMGPIFKISEMFNCWERHSIHVDGASNTLFATLFLAFHAFFYRWECQFISLFSQNNEYLELTVLLFFQNPYAIFAYILENYHDFQNIFVAIFPSIVQVYTQPYSFGGRIKLIICQIRHKLSVTIYEISTICKKR